MKRWLSFFLALVIFIGLHEGVHAFAAACYDEYAAFIVKPYGLEVIFKTPVEARTGFHWALISGTSNLATILLGYMLLALNGQIARLNGMFSKATLYYLTLTTLLLDPFNLSIGPFIYGGDANGIAVGLAINRYVVQVVFLGFFLINRELAAQKLLPVFGVKTNHPLLRPWLSLRN